MLAAGVPIPSRGCPEEIKGPRAPRDCISKVDVIGTNHVGTAALGRPVERSSTDGYLPLVRALSVTFYLNNSPLK